MPRESCGLNGGVVYGRSLLRDVVSTTYSLYHEGEGRGFGSHLIVYPELGVGVDEDPAMIIEPSGLSFSGEAGNDGCGSHKPRIAPRGGDGTASPTLGAT